MNSALTPEPPQKSWYRYGWVWFLISIPGSAVIVGSFTIWIAFTKGDTLVADDYYREGRAINQRLEKDEEAASRGILIKPSVFRLADGITLIQVQYQAAAGQPAPEFIRLRMSHPTLNERDVLATLTRVAKPEMILSAPAATDATTDAAPRLNAGAGLSSALHYQTRIPSVLAGRWHAQLEDENSVWRVKSVWVVE